MKLDFLKKYFIIFFTVYSIVLLTKVIFYLYLHDEFVDFSPQEAFYAMVWGYKFDFAIAGVVAFLATLFDWSRKLFALVGSLLVVSIFLLQIGDILYYNEANRHIGYEITDTFTDASSLFMTAYGQHRLLTLSSLALSVLLFVGLYRWLVGFPKIELRKIYVAQKLILIVLTVFFVRGMAQRIPLNPWQSNQIGERKYSENYWGVQDVDLYNFALKKIDGMNKPFVIGINGATTHDDILPKGIEPKEFSKDRAYNRQLNALHFADMALGEFIKRVEKKYPNTLFVFFADHCGGVRGTIFQSYLIPFALYHKDLEPKSYDVVLSQRDIAPTVYNLAIGDYKKDNINFSGKSLLDDQRFFADYYHNGLLGWVEKDKILELNLATNREKCYELRGFKNEEIECSDEIRSFKNRMLSFTEVSQSLLFDGKTDKFIEYRNQK